MRLDVQMAEMGLAKSRSKARELIEASAVKVDGVLVGKPSFDVVPESMIELCREICPYVSRGGLKLEKALLEFAIDLHGVVCLDIGASTGGFTDCMLQHSAAKVYALDVGHGQLAESLRQDTRIVSLERTNIRTFDRSIICEKVRFVSIDVSFISLTQVLPIVYSILNEGQVVALIKPQFECGREFVGKKGIVRDAKIHDMVTDKIRKSAELCGFTVDGLIESPITGGDGNVEFLILLKKGRDAICCESD